MIKLDNHRKLNDNEIIRKGDFYKNLETGEIRPVKFSIGRTCGYYRGYEFYRRKHTKKVASDVTQPKPGKSAKADVVVAVVSFDYRNVSRMVHVISMNDKYLTGLERTCLGYSKYKYQFKRFLRNKMRTQPTLVYYGPNTK